MDNSGKCKAYAAYSKNQEILYSSSSGGVFTHLAEKILLNNGIVFGTMFDEELNVVHNYIDRISDLPKFQGSKYVKSKIGNSFQKAKEFLDNGKIVYFSGTPCQIAGLKAYLKKDYDKLITQDVICHGSPDPKVWQKYIRCIESANNESVKNVYFRDKATGWKNYSTTIEFKNGGKRTQKATENTYMKGFLKDIYLCEPCYNCKFKNKNFFSDITLGDFWGIENVLPDFPDNSGVSFVIIRSENGQRLFDNVKSELVYSDVEYEKSAKFNTALLKPVAKHKNREQFYSEFNNGNISDKKFRKIMKKYCDDDFIIKCKIKIKKIIKRRRK